MMVSEFKLRFLGQSNAHGNGTIAGWERRAFPSGSTALVSFMANETPEWRTNLMARWNFETQKVELNPNYV